MSWMTRYGRGHVQDSVQESGVQDLVPNTLICSGKLLQLRSSRLELSKGRRSNLEFSIYRCDCPALIREYGWGRRGSKRDIYHQCKGDCGREPYLSLPFIIMRSNYLELISNQMFADTIENTPLLRKLKMQHHVTLAFWILITYSVFYLPRRRWHIRVRLPN